jgi:hypothetical protein
MISAKIEGAHTNMNSSQCSQQPTDLLTWICIIDNGNQPPPVDYTISLTATTPKGEIGTTNVKIPPPKALKA